MRGSQTISRPRSCLTADQPAGALLERYRGLRDEVVGERIAAFALEALDARFDQWISGRRERQLVDDHALQRLSRHIDAFPEALRTDQHRARVVQELLQQHPLGALALHQNGQPIAALLELAPQTIADRLQ